MSHFFFNGNFSMGDSILFLAEKEEFEDIIKKKMTKQRMVKVNKVYLIYCLIDKNFLECFVFFDDFISPVSNCSYCSSSAISNFSFFFFCFN